MGLLKLILHFWFFLSLTNIICVGVCGSIVHTSPTDPNFTFLCSTSSSPFQSHWNLSSSFGLTCYKIKEKIKKRNLTCWDRQKICEKWYDISCIFISWMLPNWGIQIKAYISWSNNYGQRLNISKEYNNRLFDTQPNQKVDRATDRCQVTTNLYGTFLKSLLYTLSTSQIKGTCKKWWGCMQFADATRDWFLISGKCVWFLCLSTSRKFFIKQWSGGSTDMFCRGCESDLTLSLFRIWIRNIAKHTEYSSG